MAIGLSVCITHKHLTDIYTLPSFRDTTSYLFFSLSPKANAEASYLAATRIDPAQALGWQGLCSLYEKADDRAIEDLDNKLLNVYRQLERCYADDQDKFREVG